MADDKIVEEFAQLHKSTSRSKTARLRDLYDHIESLRRRGFSHATIVDAMKKHGLKFDLKSFEVTFYRIRKERLRQSTQLSSAQPIFSSSTFKEAHGQTDKADKNHGNTVIKEAKAPSGSNPLHALSPNPEKKDPFSIPKRKFEKADS